jgi:hypothetical protein
VLLKSLMRSTGTWMYTRTYSEPRTYRHGPGGHPGALVIPDTPGMLGIDMTHNIGNNGYIKQHRLIKVQEDTMSNYTTAPTKCHHCGLSVFPSGSNSVTVLSDGEWIDTHFTCPA